jgi:hypothetical protein
VAKREGFRGKATAIGLVGKMTATTVGEELLPKLTAIAERLGDYPHSVLKPSGKEKVQTTRMLKLECPEDGYIVRTTAKWLDVGYPSCPCGTEMEEA